MLQFANPALLFGALLLAVPLIIHLLNRRRNKKRPWAAMEFLLRAYQKQRKRLQRENLLLLLLRCLIPILLALAIARPSLRDAGALGNLGGSAHHIFIFDRSYSMGLELPGGVTPYDRAKQLATLMVDGLGQRSGQKVSIVVSGLRPTMPLREDLSLARAKDRIASLGAPVDASTDLTAALLEVAELIEDAGDTTARAYLFTDMQVRAFGEDAFAKDADAGGVTEPAVPPAVTPGGEGGPDAAMFEDSARDAIERIQRVASLSVLDVRSRSGGGGTEDNLQVTDLRLGLPHAIARTAIPVHARILNRTASTRTVQATLEIDGGQPLRSTIELEPGSDGEANFLVTFRELGQRSMRVTIEGDGLRADDQRFLTVPVRDRIQVLLVEGSNEDEVDLQDATHLERILDPTRGEGPPELTPFALRSVDTVTFLSGRESLDEYDLVILANVPRLNESASTALETFVRSGKGLFVMLGDRIDASSYNLHLHGSGDGVQPGMLIEERGFAASGDRYYGSEILAPDHAAFRDFSEAVYFQIFEALAIHRFWFLDMARPTPAGGETESDPTAPHVIASVRDPQQSPLLVTRDFGQGKAAFLTSAIHRRPQRWNALDYEVTAFPFVHQLAHWLTLPSVDPFNVLVGTNLTATTPRRPTEFAIVLPERGGSGKVPIGDEARPLVGGRYALPPYGQTAHAGFYTYEMLSDVGGAQERDQFTFAVNPELDEGDLRYYSHQAARDRLGIESITSDLPSDGEAAIQASFSELGPLFLWLTLGAVLAEAALARWVSGRRK